MQLLKLQEDTTPFHPKDNKDRVDDFTSALASQQNLTQQVAQELMTMVVHMANQ